MLLSRRQNPESTASQQSRLRPSLLAALSVNVLKARLPRPLLRRTGLAERLLALATIRDGRLSATCSVACSLLLALIACQSPSGEPGDTSPSDSEPRDSGPIADTGGDSEPPVDTADTAPPPALDVAIWPAEPYPDSELRALADEELDSCSWWADGVEVATGCTLLGEDISLVAGDEIMLMAKVGESAGEAMAAIRGAPGLAVTETMGNSLAFLDGSTLEEQQSLVLAGGFTMPIAAVADPSGSLLWSTAHLNGTVSRVEGEPWGVTASAVVSGNIYWIDLDPDRRQLWVADQGGTTLAALDADTLEQGAVLDLPEGPVSVRIQDDIAWVACRSGGSPYGGLAESPPGVEAGWLVRVDLETETTEAVELGLEPYWAEPSPGGELVAVADQDAGELLVVDAATLELLEVFELPGGPTGVAWHPIDDRLYVSLYTEALLLELDGSTGETLRSWETGAGSVGAFMRDDGRWVYVPGLHAGSLARVDTATDAAPLVAEGLASPRGVALVP